MCNFGQQGKNVLKCPVTQGYLFAFAMKTYTVTQLNGAWTSGHLSILSSHQQGGFIIMMVPRKEQ